MQLGERILIKGGEGIDETDSVFDKDVDLVNKIKPKNQMGVRVYI